MLPQKQRRQPQAVPKPVGPDTSTLPLAATGAGTNEPPKISAPAAGVNAATGIVSAGPAVTTYTVLTTTVTQILGPGESNGKPLQTVVTSTIPITDHAAYTALTGAQSTAATSKQSSSTTSSAGPSSSSGQSSPKSSSKSNTNILIPAIVAPVVALLLLSFAVFWFWMRRRHRRELKKANFVMTPREKLHSANGSARTSGSDDKTSKPPHKVVPAAVKKNGATQQEKHSRSSPEGKFTSTQDIGVARALTSDDEQRSHASPSTGSAQGNKASPRSAHIAGFVASNGAPRNFSSPNPNARTGSSPRGAAPPNPSFQKVVNGRNSPVPRQTPDAVYAPSSQRQHHPSKPPSGSNRNGSADKSGARSDRRGPSPGRRARGPDPRSRSASGPGPRPHAGPETSHIGSRMRSGSGPGPRPYPGSDASFNGPRRAPNPDSSYKAPGTRPRNLSNVSGSSLSPSASTRAAAPAPINTIAVGAYNGTGPISQYSPIVQDTSQTSGQPRRKHQGPAPSVSATDSFLLDTSGTASPTSPQYAAPRPGLGIASSSSPSGGHRPRISAVSEMSFDYRDHDAPPMPARDRNGDEYEDDDVKSEVSSLHEDSDGNAFTTHHWTDPREADQHGRVFVKAPSRSKERARTDPRRSRSVSPIR